MSKASSALGVQPAPGGAPKRCCVCHMRQDHSLPFPVAVNPRLAAACAVHGGRNQLCPVSPALSQPQYG